MRTSMDYGPIHLGKRAVVKDIPPLPLLWSCSRCEDKKYQEKKNQTKNESKSPLCRMTVLQPEPLGGTLQVPTTTEGATVEISVKNLVLRTALPRG